MLPTTRRFIRDLVHIASAATIFAVAGCTPPSSWEGDFVGTDTEGRAAYGDFRIEDNSVSGHVDGYAKTGSLPDLSGNEGDDGVIAFQVGSDSVTVQIVDSHTTIVRRNGEPLVLDFPSGHMEPASAMTDPEPKPAAVGNKELLFAAGLATLACWSWSSISCTLTGQGTFDYNNGAVFDVSGQYGGGYCAYPCTSPSSSAYCGDGACNGGESCQSCAADCGSCGSTCYSHDHLGCSNGNVYWYNSCSGLEDMAQSCGGCGCSNGACNSCQPTVDPHVSVTPTSGPKGTVFQEPGWGFTPNGQAQLYFVKPDGTTYPAISVDVDSAGKFVHAYDSSTASIFGTYQYYAIDVPSGKSSPSVTYTITQ